VRHPHANEGFCGLAMMTRHSSRPEVASGRHLLGVLVAGNRDGVVEYEVDQREDVA
jgi:hypothetical protein